jgi:hypothetical protein
LEQSQAGKAANQEDLERIAAFFRRYEDVADWPIR